MRTLRSQRNRQQQSQNSTSNDSGKHDHIVPKQEPPEYPTSQVVTRSISQQQHPRVAARSTRANRAHAAIAEEPSSSTNASRGNGSTPSHSRPGSRFDSHPNSPNEAFTSAPVAPPPPPTPKPVQVYTDTVTEDLVPAWAVPDVTSLTLPPCILLHSGPQKQLSKFPNPTHVPERAESLVDKVLRTPMGGTRNPEADALIEQMTLASARSPDTFPEFIDPEDEDPAFLTAEQRACLDEMAAALRSLESEKDQLSGRADCINNEMNKDVDRFVQMGEFTTTFVEETPFDNSFSNTHAPMDYMIEAITTQNKTVLEEFKAPMNKFDGLYSNVLHDSENLPPLGYAPDEVADFEDMREAYQPLIDELKETMVEYEQDKLEKIQQHDEEYSARREEFLERQRTMERNTKRIHQQNQHREICERTFPEIRRAREEKERSARSEKRPNAKKELAAQRAQEQAKLDEKKKLFGSAIIPPLNRTLITPDMPRLKIVHDSVEQLNNQMQRFLDDWTEEERKIFQYKFITYGKNFAAIGACIGSKTTNQCVEYFYHTKQFVKYKQLHKAKRKKAGKAYKPPIMPTQCEIMQSRASRFAFMKTNKYVECLICERQISVFMVPKMRNGKILCGEFEYSMEDRLPICDLCNTHIRKAKAANFSKCPIPGCSLGKRRTKPNRTIPETANKLDLIRRRYIIYKRKVHPEAVKCCGSCIRKIQNDFNDLKAGRLDEQVREFTVKRLDTKRQKESVDVPEWSQEETELLKQAVADFGHSNWYAIACQINIPDKTPYFCYVKYRELIKRDIWFEKEDPISAADIQNDIVQDPERPMASYLTSVLTRDFSVLAPVMEEDTVALYTHPEPSYISDVVQFARENNADVGEIEGLIQRERLTRSLRDCLPVVDDLIYSPTPSISGDEPVENISLEGLTDRERQILRHLAFNAYRERLAEQSESGSSTPASDNEDDLDAMLQQLIQVAGEEFRYNSPAPYLNGITYDEEKENIAENHLAAANDVIYENGIPANEVIYENGVLANGTLDEAFYRPPEANVDLNTLSLDGQRMLEILQEGMLQAVANGVIERQREPTPVPVSFSNTIPVMQSPISQPSPAPVIPIESDSLAEDIRQFTTNQLRGLFEPTTHRPAAPMSNDGFSAFLQPTTLATPTPVIDPFSSLALPAPSLPMIMNDRNGLPPAQVTLNHYNPQSLTMASEFAMPNNGMLNNDLSGLINNGHAGDNTPLTIFTSGGGGLHQLSSAFTTGTTMLSQLPNPFPFGGFNLFNTNGVGIQPSDISRVIRGSEFQHGVITPQEPFGLRRSQRFLQTQENAAHLSEEHPEDFKTEPIDLEAVLAAHRAETPPATSSQISPPLVKHPDLKRKSGVETAVLPHVSHVGPYQVHNRHRQASHSPHDLMAPSTKYFRPEEPCKSVGPADLCSSTAFDETKETQEPEVKPPNLATMQEQLVQQLAVAEQQQQLHQALQAQAQLSPFELPPMSQVNTVTSNDLLLEHLSALNPALQINAVVASLQQPLVSVTDASAEFILSAADQAFARQAYNRHPMPNGEVKTEPTWQEPLEAAQPIGTNLEAFNTVYPPLNVSIEEAGRVVPLDPSMGQLSVSVDMPNFFQPAQHHSDGFHAVGDDSSESDGFSDGHRAKSSTASSEQNAPVCDTAFVKMMRPLVDDVVSVAAEAALGHARIASAPVSNHRATEVVSPPEFSLMVRHGSMLKLGTVNEASPTLRRCFSAGYPFNKVHPTDLWDSSIRNDIKAIRTEESNYRDEHDPKMERYKLTLGCRARSASAGSLLLVVDEQAARMRSYADEVDAECYTEERNYGRPPAEVCFSDDGDDEDDRNPREMWMGSPIEQKPIIPALQDPFANYSFKSRTHKIEHPPEGYGPDVLEIIDYSDDEEPIDMANADKPMVSRIGYPVLYALPCNVKRIKTTITIRD